MLRYFLLFVGTISFILGAIGVFMPLLPTTPFLLLTGYCYTRSSKRAHDYFVSTNLYTNYVVPFQDNGGLSKKRKVRILAFITLTMGISIYFTPHWPVKLGLLLMLLHFYWRIGWKLATIDED